MIEKEAKNNQSGNQKPIVSIVICTHQRPQYLKLAIDSILAQNDAEGLAELLIIDNDNAVNENIKRLVDTAQKKICSRYIHEPQIGLSHARNTGGKLAKADYIYYLDDDAQIPLDYLANLIEVINSHQPDICFGPVLPYYDSPKPKWFHDSYGAWAPFDQLCLVDETKSAPGGNMIIKKELCQKVGWFDSAFGMTGNKIGYGEETDLQKRVWTLVPNLKCVYAPKLYIEHLVRAEKMTVWWKIKSTYMSGYDHAYLFDINSCKEGLIKKIINILFLLFRYNIRIGYNIFFRNKAKQKYYNNFLYEMSFAPLGCNIRFLIDYLKKDN